MRTVILLSTLALLAATASAQTRLTDIPRYDRYERMVEQGRDLAVGGTVSKLHWTDDGRLFYTRVDDRFVVDLAAGTVRITGEDEEPEREGDESRRRRRPRRGRQHDHVKSPDGTYVAVSRDWNVVLEDDDEEVVAEVTREGTERHRFGTASWVYGEELGVRDAMWWTPDSKKLVFYVFDETDLEPYYLLDGLEKLRPSVTSELYPKPGESNPVPGLLIYDVQSGETVPIDTGPVGDGDVGHYVFSVRMTPNGDALLFSRTNRHQNILEVVAVDLETGAGRVVVREEQETWQENRPDWRFLDDGERFIWETERSGYKHYELRSLAGHRIATLTTGAYSTSDIEHVDEGGGWLYYTAYSDQDVLSAQLHRVRLDGTSAERLTIGPGHHSVRASPDGRWFVVRVEAAATAPRTFLMAADGRVVTALAESDTSAMDEQDIVPVERFVFTAADGTTELHGLLYKPTDFDPALSYPLIVDVYGGPQSRMVTNRFRPVRALTELGCLVARIGNRGTTNRGKAFESATYLRLGTVDLADQVEGVRALVGRSYVNGDRVGIYGHSYGGYMAALALLRYPDVYHAAAASGTVSDWRNYDTIYTERYMRTPAENAEGYDLGSCMTYADQYAGRLLLVHGMEDNNVHPTNMWQLADALQREGFLFQMMLVPNRGHNVGSRGRNAVTRFLYDELIRE